MTATTFVAMATKSLQPDPENIRRGVGDIRELTESVKAIGILEPIIAVAEPGTTTFTIVCGHRRHAAAKAAKLATVPVVVLADVDRAGRTVAQLAENLNRGDLSPTEEAAGYQQALDQGVTQRQLAAKVGRSQAHISKRTKLLALPAKVRSNVDDGSVSIGAALELVRVADQPKLLAHAAEKIRTGNGAPAKAVVDRVIEADQVLRRRTEIADRLQGDGIRVLPWKSPYTAKWRPIAEGNDPSLWRGVERLKIPRARLEADGTFAAVVTDEADVLYVCADPARYRPKTAKTRAASDKAAVDREKAERAQAAGDRLPYLRKIVATLPNLPAVVAVVAVNADLYVDPELVCEVLEIPLSGEGPKHRNKHAAAVDAALLVKPTVVAVAMALAAVHNDLTDGYIANCMQSRFMLHLFYGLLTDVGYEPSTPWERKLVDTLAKQFTATATKAEPRQTRTRARTS